MPAVATIGPCKRVFSTLQFSPAQMKSHHMIAATQLNRMNVDRYCARVGARGQPSSHVGSCLFNDRTSYLQDQPSILGHRKEFIW